MSLLRAVAQRGAPLDGEERQATASSDRRAHIHCSPAPRPCGDEELPTDGGGVAGGATAVCAANSNNPRAVLSRNCLIGEQDDVPERKKLTVEAPSRNDVFERHGIHRCGANEHGRGSVRGARGGRS